MAWTCQMHSSGTEMSRRSCVTPTGEMVWLRLFIVLTDDVALSHDGRWALGGLSDVCLGKTKWRWRGEGEGGWLVQPGASVCLLRKVLACCCMPSSVWALSQTGPMGIPEASHRCACLAGGGSAARARAATSMLVRKSVHAVRPDLSARVWELCGSCSLSAHCCRSSPSGWEEGGL